MGPLCDDSLSTFMPIPETVCKDMAGLGWLVEAWRSGQPMSQAGMFLISRPLLESENG